MELGERVVPAAEVVQRDPDAAGTEAFDHRGGAGQVRDTEGLGDLDDQPGRRHRVPGQGGVDGVLQALLAEPAGGDVDVHGDRAAEPFG